MASLMRWLIRTFLRLLWLVFGVIPGHLLAWAHHRMQAARGRPEPTLLPGIVYQLVGLILVILCISGANSILLTFGYGQP